MERELFFAFSFSTNQWMRVLHTGRALSKMCKTPFSGVVRSRCWFLTLCLVCPLQEEPSDPLWTSEVFTFKGKVHYMELKLFNVQVCIL